MISVTLADTLTDLDISLHPESPISLTFDKTETLESGVLVCKHLTREDSFIEGDTVTIVIDAETFYFIIETDDVNEVAKDIFNHSVTIVEVTAKLTKYVGADRYFTLASQDYIDHLEIIRETVPLNGNPAFNIPTATDTFLSTNASEKKYEGIHLYSNLIELFRSKNAVPRLLNNGDLTYNLYNEVNNPITLADLKGNRKSKNFTNYALAVRSKAKNISHTAVQGAIWYPSSTEGVTPRSTSNKYSDDNAIWTLPESVKNLFVATIVDYETSAVGPAGGVTIDLDISEYVISKDEWDGLIVGDATITALVVGELAQRKTIYYNIGDNILNNIGSETSPAIGLDYTVSRALITSALIDAGYEFLDYKSIDIQDIKLKLFYTPYFDADMTSEKESGVEKRSTVLTNQKDRLLDIQRYSNVLKGTINRMANDEWSITKKHDSLSDRFELGDYTADNYQIIRSTFEIYPNKVDAIYELSKNFINLDAQQSISNQPRPYTISRETIKTAFVFTEYIELSNTLKTETSSITQTGINRLLNVLDYDVADDKPIYNSEYESDDSPLGANERYSSSAIAIATSDGIRIFTGFNSPNVAGTQLIADPNWIGAGKKLNQLIYTDNGGLMESAQYNFVNESTIVANDHPLVTEQTTNLMLVTPTINFNLQPNEIFRYTHELLTAVDDTFLIYEPFLAHNSFVTEIDGVVPTLTCFISEADTFYNIYDTHVKNSIGTTSYSSSSALRKLDVTSDALTSTRTWAIADSTTGELYCAVNQSATDNSVVRWNFLNERTSKTDL